MPTYKVTLTTGRSLLVNAKKNEVAKAYPNADFEKVENDPQARPLCPADPTHKAMGINARDKLTGEVAQWRCNTCGNTQRRSDKPGRKFAEDNNTGEPLSGAERARRYRTKKKDGA